MVSKKNGCRVSTAPGKLLMGSQPFCAIVRALGPLYPFERDLPIPPVLQPTALTPVPGTPAATVGSAAVFHGIAPEFNHPPCPDWALFPLKTYQITMKKAIAQIVPDVDTEVFGYNGLVPGPTIVPRFREPVVVRQFNALDVEASVHLHGGHQPAGSDGHPSFFVLPGKARDYSIPISLRGKATVRATSASTSARSRARCGITTTPWTSPGST
jgi:hypothetical protein